MLKNSSASALSAAAVARSARRSNKTKTFSFSIALRAVSTTAATTTPAQTPVRLKSTAALAADYDDYSAVDEFMPWIRRETMHTGSTLVQAMLP